MATESKENSVNSSASPLKILHEFARRKKVFLDYQLENESGPAHSKTFTIRLRFGDKEYRGVDRSIKLAQRAAAKIAFEDQRELFLETNQQEDSTKTRSESATVLLNTWALQNHISTRYVLLQEENLIFYRLFVGSERFFDGHGATRAEARQNCATMALNFFRENKVPVSTSFNVEKSPVSLIYERARQLGLSIQMENPSPSTIVYRIGENYSSSATGSTKQIAKRLAAEKLLQILPKAELEKKNPKRTHQQRKFIEQRGSLDYSRTEEINPITRIYQIGRAKNVRVEYRQIEEKTSNNLFHFVVEFGEENRADGFATSKQGAKRAAAENLLVQFQQKEPMKSLLKREETSNNEKKHVHFLVDESIKDENRPTFGSIKEKLRKSCEKFHIQIDFQDEPKTNDEENAKTILSLSIDQRLLAKFRGEAATIRRAQENASAAAWKNLRDLFNGSISTSTFVQ